jgi:hypothetical protein
MISVNVKTVLAILASVVSISCAAPGLINFEAMIPEDLAIYNEGLELDEQVVCQPAHSDWVNDKHRHVPKWCKTVGYIKKLQNSSPNDWAGAGYGNSGGNHQPADAADYHSSTFNGGHN